MLAVRAENRPAPSKNPAGLIARLAVTLADGRQLVVVSDGSWRAENELRPQWEQAAFDDAAWKAAAVVGAVRRRALGKDRRPGTRTCRTIPSRPTPAKTPAVKELYFAVRRVKRNILFKNPVLDFTQLLFIDQPLPQGPINPEHEAIHRMGIMAVPGGRLLVLDGLHPGGQLRQLAPGQARQFLAARSVVRCPPGAVLLQAARREELPPVRDEPRRHGPAAADRQRVRRHRSDLPARRPHPVHHHARQLVRPLRAVHLLVHPGPLRRRRRQRVPDQLQRRAGLRAGAAERRPRDLFPLGVLGQAAVAAAEAVDDQPGRHRHGAFLGQPIGLARSSVRAAPDPRQPPRDVLRRGASRLVVGLDRHRRPGPGPRLPARPDQGHRRPALAGSQPAAGRPAGGGRLPRLGPLHRLQDGLSAVRGGFPRLGPRAWATSSACT